VFFSAFTLCIKPPSWHCSQCTAVCQSPKQLAADISIRQTVASWIFRGFVAAHFPPPKWPVLCRVGR